MMCKNVFFYDDYKHVETKPMFAWPQFAELYPDNPYPIKTWMKLIKEMQQTCSKRGIGFTVITTGYKPD